MKGFAVLALLAALAFVNCQDEVEPSSDSTAQQETTTAAANLETTTAAEAQDASTDAATTEKPLSDRARCREAFGLQKDDGMPFTITKTKCATVCSFLFWDRIIPENEGQDCEISGWFGRKSPGKCAKGQCEKNGRRR